jgi:hypothetical protein
MGTLKYSHEGTFDERWYTVLRRFINLDGDIMADEEWRVKPIDCCFWCDKPLILVKGTPCPYSLGTTHEFITVCGGRDG